MREVKAVILVPEDDQEKRNFARDPEARDTEARGRKEQRSHQERGQRYSDRLADGYRMMGMGGDGA